MLGAVRFTCPSMEGLRVPTTLGAWSTAIDDLVRGACKAPKGGVSMLGLGAVSKKIFGTANDRKVKAVRPLVDKDQRIGAGVRGAVR